MINVHRSSCKVPVFYCQILINHEFSRQIFEKYFKTSNFMKIRPVEHGVLQSDGQTDNDEDNSCIFTILRKRLTPRK